MNLGLLLAFILVSLTGAAVGITELVSRYRDAPIQAVVTLPAGLYVALNSLASFTALAVFHHERWLASLANSPTDVLILQTIVAGLSAMAAFRAALFTVRVGNQDVSVGPAGFLQILLAAADRACDRERAGPRALQVGTIMAEISFEKAKVALPSLCFNLMQNVSTEEQKSFGMLVKELEASNMEEAVKVKNLGLALMNVVGAKVLDKAVQMLKDTIHATPSPIVHSLATLSALRKVSFEIHASTLTLSCLFLADQIDKPEAVTSLETQLRTLGAMALSDDRKVFMLSASLIGTFGEEIVQSALRSLQTAPGKPTAGTLDAATVRDDTSGGDNVVDLNTARTELEGAAIADSASRDAPATVGTPESAKP